ncbi:hypothetical protein GCM10022389_18260 [Flavobacterium cheonanense]|uniref:DUF3570 domain-containing protein n=2 Tax=Flavobacterium cheonanense TaxID=706183 RepID=A0ABP7VRV9_9FLAO
MQLIFNKIMQNKLVIVFFLFSALVFSQETEVVKDSTVTFKKRVLESTEVDFMLSYYNQDGLHSSVSGGIGSEKLTDIASNIVVAIPMNDDDVLTIDAGISAYTSASSSNINPYDSKNPTPWQSSSGASEQDALVSLVANYSHSSNDRNFIWNADVSFSNEYDYTSIGFGGGVSKLFNDKNSEVSVKVNAYLDQWRPIYPGELRNGNFSSYNPLFSPNFVAWDSTARNSYSASISFSQVLTKKTQFSIFFDLVQQEGKLSSPYHRIYFADKPNYYFGNPSFIPNYENTSNAGVYRLADAIEKLPSSRFKLPIGLRWNYYINETFVVRTYYRYYTDNWDITAHTASIEVPIKLTDKFTVSPMYRYYTQTQSKYFAPFEKHLSTEEFYTSDYDLSSFNANQYGLGVSYTDIFTSSKIWKFGLKNIDFRFNHYNRSDGLSSNIGSLGFKFVMQ